MSEEEVTTYSGLVRILRERIAGYVREGVERARALRELVRLVGEPIEVGGRLWRGSVGAADGGSSILSFADRDVGFISAITVVDDSLSNLYYHQRLASHVSEESRTLLLELFDKAAHLKNKVEEFRGLKTASFQELVGRARGLWVGYRPKPADHAVLAVDSGWNYRLYEGFYVYALKAAAVDDSMNILHSAAEVDILAGDPHDAFLVPELTLKYMAESYEHDIALRASDNCDLVLVDGSLIARLEDIKRRDSPRLRTEYFASAKPLNGLKNVAFVSKYSHDKSLLGGELGDIFYLNAASSEVGYTRPHTINRDGWAFSIFYVRLSENANALHVEVPAAVDEGFARLFIDMLCGTAVRGYPYTLMAAHKAVNVPDSLMDMLCKAAGLTGLHTAREVLRV
jgi:hypothetical protein